MIEALIIPRDSGPHAKGDFVCVKPLGSPWGSEELKRFALIEHDDPALETKLTAMVQAGERFPCIAYPYSILRATPLDPKKPTGPQTYSITQVSSKEFVIDSLPADIKAAVLDPTISVPKLTKDQIKDVPILTKP